MKVRCELQNKVGNPQTPDKDGDAMKVIVEFPLFAEYVQLLECMHSKSFQFQIEEGDKIFTATLYRPVDDSFSTKEKKPDDSAIIVVCILYVLAHVRYLADIHKAVATSSDGTLSPAQRAFATRFPASASG